MEGESMSTDTLINTADTPPNQIGWYATLHTWDTHEGFFPGAHYWDGVNWQPGTTASVRYWPTVFETEQEANTYAWDNDPEW